MSGGIDKHPTSPAFGAIIALEPTRTFGCRLARLFDAGAIGMGAAAGWDHDRRDRNEKDGVNHRVE
jgi:hypothetical protein